MESSIEISQTGGTSNPKPTLAPKPRLAPKPFSVQKNTTIRSIHAPKVATSKTTAQQPGKSKAAGVPKPTVTTTDQKPPTQTTTSHSKPSPVSVLTKDRPKAPKESKASSHAEDTLDSGVGKSDPASQTAPPKKTPKSEPIQRDDVIQANHKASTDVVNSAQIDGKKKQDKTPTPVDEKSEESGRNMSSSDTPEYRLSGQRKRLSMELTSKFESAGLSLPPVTTSKTSTKGHANKPESSDPKPSHTTSEPSDRECDEGALTVNDSEGGSIKRRISLLFDSSSKPEAVTKREEPEMIDGAGGVKGVKERIKNWATEIIPEGPETEKKPRVAPRTRSKCFEPATAPKAVRTPPKLPVESPATTTSSSQAVDLLSEVSPAEQLTETPMETSEGALTAVKSLDSSGDTSGVHMHNKSAEGDRSSSTTHTADADEADLAASESTQHAPKRDDVKRRSVRFGVVERDDGGPPVILGSPSDSSEEEEEEVSEEEAEEDIPVSLPVYKRVGGLQKKDDDGGQEQEEERLKHLEFEKRRRAEEHELAKLKLKEEWKQKQEEEREKEKARLREEEKRERERLEEEEKERQRKEEWEREKLKEEERKRERLREEEMERKRQKELVWQREEEKERAKQKEERLKQDQEEREKERLKEEEERREQRLREERERQRLKEEELERERLEEERKRERLREEEMERKRQKELMWQRQREEEKERLKEEARKEQILRDEGERQRMREEKINKEKQREEEWEKEWVKKTERLRREEKEKDREKELELMRQRQEEEERERQKEERLREERERQRLSEEERPIHDHEELRLEGKLREKEMNKEKQREEEWEKEWVKRTGSLSGEEEIERETELELMLQRQKEENRERARQKEERLRQEEREKERLREEAMEREREMQRKLKEQQEKEEEIEEMRQIEIEKQREEKRREEERKRQIEKERVEELERKMREELDRKRVQEQEEKLRMEEERQRDESESAVDKAESNLISFDSEDVLQRSESPYSPTAKTHQPRESEVEVVYDDFSVRPPLVSVDFDDFSVKPKRWGSQAKVETCLAVSVDKEEVEVPAPLDVSPWEYKVPEQVEKPGRPEPTLAQEYPEEEEEHLISMEVEEEKEAQTEEEEETKEAEMEEDEEEAPANSYSSDVKDTDALIDIEPDQHNEACEPTSNIDSLKPSPDQVPEVSEDVDEADFHIEPERTPFPESSTPLLDTSVQRSKADLGKRRSRTRPSRSLRGGVDRVEIQDWRTRDSTDEKEASSKRRDSVSEEEQPKPKIVCSPTISQRVPMFPGLNPAALIAQMKKRTGGGGNNGGEEAAEDRKEERESQNEEVARSPSQLSRSPRSAAHLPGAARVLPHLGGTDGGAVSSPAWLKELKSKKRLSQYDSEV